MRLLRHVGSELAAHPGRSALSAVSLFMGVVAIVAIFTVGLVTSEVFVAGVEQQAGRRVTVETTLSVPSRNTVTALTNLAGVLRSLRAAGGGFAILSSVSGRFGQRAETRPGSPLTGPSASVTLVSGDLGSVRRLPVLAGDWFDESVDLPLQMVVNMPGAAVFGGPGSTWLWEASPRREPVSVTVSGVIADGSTQVRVYLPLLTLTRQDAEVFGGSAEVPTIDLTLLLHHPTASIASLRDLAAVGAVAAGAAPPESVDRVDEVDYFLDQLDTQQNAFLIVAIVALVIAAIGILNIGLSSVAERARELVIRRAMGATRAQIVLQLMLAAATIGAITTVFAVGVGIVGVEVWAPTLITPQSAVEPPSFPWDAAGWGLLASVLTTLMGAAVPALVAARLDIATALRD